VDLKGSYRKASSLRLGRRLPFANGRFTLPRLGDYDVVILE
jgi:hypothetical protein